MAITDQFVTSFSELYIGTQVALPLGATPSDSAVKGFFAPSGSVAVSASVAAAAVIAFTDTRTGIISYFKNTTVSSITLTSDEQASLEMIANKTGLDLLSSRIPLVMEIGTLSNEATVIDTPTFGETYKGKLRGQLDGGQLDTQLYWAPRNGIHELLRTYAENGTAVNAGIRWLADKDATTGELVVFESFVSSFGIDTTFDDVAKASPTLVVDGAEHFVEE